MTFLDPRQRAMLAEMGVRVWAPKPLARPVLAEAEAASEVPTGAPVQQVRAATREVVAAPVPSPRPPAPPALVRKPPEEIRVAQVAAPPDSNALASRPEGVERMDWAQLEAAVSSCQACGLCAGRTNTVFGVGSQRADWMVVGEAPGENEDRLGQPFVGQAGKLLDNMLAAIGLSRQVDAAAESSEQSGKQGVYITNVLKCRPPSNRNPRPEEIVQCEPYLRRQVELLRPKIILAMGRFAVQSLLQTNDPIGRLRGQVHQYEGVPVIVTYHPAYLLRSLPDKAKAWEDLCLALEVAQGSTNA
ncbi:uracil-DNA glycosylase [Ottowia caeni]|uniref:uracil-DNA glycosylase n=1 Tax=Ottowia caeni TaxID=2870339 RepID=UPI001E5EEB3A|nr:uracil-DNA glycosylase [Ottowia caeni]